MHLCKWKHPVEIRNAGYQDWNCCFPFSSWITIVSAVTGDEF